MKTKRTTLRIIDVTLVAALTVAGCTTPAKPTLLPTQTTIPPTVALIAPATITPTSIPSPTETPIPTLTETPTPKPTATTEVTEEPTASQEALKYPGIHVIDSPDLLTGILNHTRSLNTEELIFRASIELPEWVRYFPMLVGYKLDASGLTIYYAFRGGFGDVS